MDLRDAALQAACPVVAAPRYGELTSMANGQRVVVAANGLFVQIKLDWLDCMQRLMPAAPGMPLPYGTVHERLVFSFGVLPIRLIEAFIEAGRRGLPMRAIHPLSPTRRCDLAALRPPVLQGKTGPIVLRTVPSPVTCAGFATSSFSSNPSWDPACRPTPSSALPSRGS